MCYNGVDEYVYKIIVELLLVLGRNVICGELKWVELVSCCYDGVDVVFWLGSEIFEEDMLIEEIYKSFVIVIVMCGEGNKV